jgi:flagellar motility protein MotE (MotC chaperone)
MLDSSSSKAGEFDGTGPEGHMSEERLTRIEHNLQAFRDELRDEFRGEFAGVNARLDRHDQRFNEVDQRFDNLEAKVDRTLVKFESLEDKFQVLAESQDALAQTVKEGFANIPHQIAKALAPLNLAVQNHSVQLADHARRIKKLEAR